MYDGVTAQGAYSTAALARTLDLPVLLVVDCTKTTRTIAAMVLGCLKFDPRLKISGVVLNQVATKRQQTIITEAVEHYTDIPVLGVLPRLKHDIFPMRHLGMIPHQEYQGSESAVNLLGRIARENIDIERLESLMVAVRPTAADLDRDLVSVSQTHSVRIGIMQDAAFQFYYPENLAALERRGAELVTINALVDDRLPELDGLYIGGGFPETSAPQLAANEEFRYSVRNAAAAGLPIYAECGGLIYLGSSIVLDQQEYPLAGVFPIRFGMSEKPQAHGYSIFTVDRENPFYPEGLRVKGHEFRYSTILDWQGEPAELALKMERGTGFMHGRDGLTYKNVLALYTHIHAEGTVEWAEEFVKKCRDYRRSG